MPWLEPAGRSNRTPAGGEDWVGIGESRQAGLRVGDTTGDRRLLRLFCLGRIAAGGAGPAMAQACSRDGNAVRCDDGRRGLWLSDVILWPNGARSSAVPQQGVVTGNGASVRGGAGGVFVGYGKGVVNAPDALCSAGGGSLPSPAGLLPIVKWGMWCVGPGSAVHREERCTASGTRCVPRVLRNAISAFTRVFDAPCLAA